MRDFHLPGRSPVFAANGMCATSHPLAAKVAVQILEAGGNAVDAAIAGAVLLGIAEPHMTGIGGDCFALVARPDGEVLALNGSGRAPMALDPERLRADGHKVVPPRSAHAVTVPGAVDALCRLAADHGRVGLASALAPAIHYAEAGIPVAPRVAADWHANAGALTGAARAHYLHRGAAPPTGTRFRAPRQAALLRRIAQQGRSAFYEGAAAADMVSSLRDLGGAHTMEDFAACACAYTRPISAGYGPFELLEHPPNGQGATALLMAGILAGFDLAALDPLGPDRAHLEAEAAKLAHDARDRFIADPDHAGDPARLAAPDMARALAALIRPDRAIRSPRRAAGAVHRDTVYITVVDADRMAVSLIASIYHAFGAGIASKDFGILFHNRGAGFTLEPGHPNEAGGGKRPLHTIIPALLRESGRVTIAFGVMGGHYQPSGHIRFLTNIADFGMDPQTAIDAPRSFADGAELKLERGYPDAVRRALAGKGHEVITPDRPLGGAQAIRIHHDSGVLEGASDPRKDGCALGY